MRRIPVCRGEFGLLVRYHVPWVHALPGPKLVEIEEGMEALYPSADRWEVVRRGDDDERRGLPGWSPPPGGVLERFVPEPHVPQGVELPWDVVVCPRERRYGSAKNWPHWAWLAEALEAEDLSVYAAGAPDSSADVQVPRAWDHARFLDASIEAMLHARLVVSTDAGLAHLAVLCGRPLFLITHRGLVAPGPVLDAEGRELKPRYWPVRMGRYYHAANHRGAEIRFTGAWENRRAVLREILTTLENGGDAE